MTNPGDTVRVRARRGGRASVYEANGWCQAFTDGLLEGFGVVPNTIADLNVLVGGTSARPDVVLATNPSGYRIALDLVSQQVITITTPATNARISSIVAYTDDLALATTESNVTGSPASCGLIVVNGAASSTPIAPSDTDIRAAITADGAAGSQASYAVIANILVTSNTTTITNSLITVKRAQIASDKVAWETMENYYAAVAHRNITNTVTEFASYNVKATGKYFVFGTAGFNSETTGLTAHTLIRKNSQNVEQTQYTSHQSYVQMNISTIINTNSGDKLSICTYGDLAGVTANGYGLWNFGVIRIG